MEIIKFNTLFLQLGKLRQMKKKRERANDLPPSASQKSELSFRHQAPSSALTPWFHLTQPGVSTWHPLHTPPQ